MHTQRMSSFCKLLVTTAFLFGFSTSAHAQGWYGGISVGSFDDEIIDDSDTGWKLYVGSKINESLGFEFGYVDLGKVTERAGTLFISAETSGFNATVLGHLPVSPQASFFGKFGFFIWESDITTNFIGSGSDDGTDITYGLGFRYNLSKSNGIRVEWEHFEDDVGDLLSVGVTFNF